eukprot:TRINITY_DN5958_c0_g1_i1.p1 TRINITY_DN5958_c0_g1~~TRINITY_DN5958_c0_g1_i1.p1  ORF type:complete len:214 (+),score=27.08 TRINITY_DN5958_c0_g1_i1:159-800(+)
MCIRDRDNSGQCKDWIQMKYVLGYRADLKNNIFLHYDQNRVIYPAGNVITINNNENKPEFLMPNNKSRGITCITQSRSKKYLAWAEEADHAIIVVYDLESKKTKSLSLDDQNTTSYVSLDFSIADEKKYLVALTAPPDSSLIYFQWDKGLFLGQTVNKQEGQQLTHCFYHPKEEEFVLVMGYGQLKSYKLYQNSPPKQKDCLLYTSPSPRDQA